MLGITVSVIICQILWYLKEGYTGKKEEKSIFINIVGPENTLWT